MNILYSIKMVAKAKEDNSTNEKELEDNSTNEKELEEKTKRNKDYDSYNNSVDKLKEIISNSEEIILEIYGEKFKIELKDLSKERSFLKFKEIIDYVGISLEKKMGIETSFLYVPGHPLLLAANLLKEEFKVGPDIYCQYQVAYRLDQKKISEIASELNITEYSNKEDADKFYTEVITRFKNGLIKCEETILLPKEISKAFYNRNREFDNSIFEKQIPTKIVDKNSGVLFSDEFETIQLTEQEQKAIYIIQELYFYLEKENLINNIKIVKGVSEKEDIEILENLKNILTLWPAMLSRAIVKDLLFQSLVKSSVI